MKALELCNKALGLLRQDEGDEYRYNVAIAVKEAIEELEQYIKENGELLGLQQQKIIELQNRSCDGCKYEGTKVIDCLDCSRYYRDRYEQKENE